MAIKRVKEGTWKGSIGINIGFLSLFHFQSLGWPLVRPFVVH